MWRASRALLVGATLLLASGDWLIGRTDAQPAGEPSAPQVAPNSARLTGNTPHRALIDGIEVELSGDDEQGYALTFHNPSRRARAGEWQVACARATGTGFSRVPPTFAVLQTRRIRVDLAAGATVRQPYELRLPEAARAQPPLPFTYTTVAFRFRPVDAAADAASIAEVRTSATAPQG